MTNRRVSLGDRLRQDQPEPASPAGRGAAAFLPPETAAPGQNSAGAVMMVEAARPVSPSLHDDTWDANHKRVTFYCPLDLVRELEQAVRTTGRSKSRLLVDGLRLALRDVAKGRR